VTDDHECTQSLHLDFDTFVGVKDCLFAKNGILKSGIFSASLPMHGILLMGGEVLVKYAVETKVVLV